MFNLLMYQRNLKEYQDLAIGCHKCKDFFQKKISEISNLYLYKELFTPLPKKQFLNIFNALIILMQNNLNLFKKS